MDEVWGLVGENKRAAEVGAVGQLGKQGENDSLPGLNVKLRMSHHEQNHNIGI